MADISNAIGTCYDGMGFLDSALNTILTGLKLTQKGCDEEIEKRLIMNLTSVYISIENFKMVDSICKSAIMRWPDWKGNQTMEYVQTNRAIALANLGDFSGSSKIFTSLYINANEKGNISEQIDALGNLGALYGIQNKLDSAEFFFNIALSLCDTSRYSNHINLLQNLAALAADKGDLKKGLALCDTAYNLAESASDLQLQVILQWQRAKMAYEIGNHKLSWSFVNSYNSLKDSLINVEKVHAIADVQEKYESEKNLREIKELEVENLDSKLRQEKLERLRNIYLTTGFLVLLLAIGLWSRLNFIKRSKAALQKEKDISENLLLNILPEEVADELKQKGYTDAKEFDQATILFTDFKGFTSMSQTMTASDLVNEIDTCFKAFDDIIDKYGLEKIKTIGDAYMAAGGLPVPDSCLASDVVKAGLEMQDFIIQRHEKHFELGLPAFEMRVGIHTGPVIAGVVGLKKFQYDIWGDTVNTASRIESSGEVGKVNISEGTYNLLKGVPEFRFKQRGKIVAKGKGKIEMYFVSLTS